MNLSAIQSTRRTLRAFTLIEILTAVAITTIIVFTLVSMFNTSARALREANRQTDVWEAARATFGILERGISEVAAGGATNRINLFAATAPPTIHLGINNGTFGEVGTDLRLEDIYVLSRDNNDWLVNVYMAGRQQKSDLPTTPLRTLYRYQARYPAVNPDGTILPIDYANIADSNHAFNKALDALEQYLDDKANGVQPAGDISVMADGIVHLRLVPYAHDGRAYTNNADLNLSQPELDSLEHYVDADTIRFWGNDLPASLDLEMFVLAPDRIQEFRAQTGSQKGVASTTLYLQSHLSSLELFRTRIPIHRDLLATQ